MTEWLEIEPNISRLVNALRDMGYTFDVAVADLIDNSVEAGATAINIQVGWSADGNLMLSIADNGSGMNYEELKEAMRYGAVGKDEQHRLGKYGLGLKTASTGFCKCLKLASTRGNGAALKTAEWDLDVVAEQGSWLYRFDDASPEVSDEFADQHEVLERLSGADADHGTLVTWEKIDRLLLKQHGEPYKNPGSALDRKRDSLKNHLRLVFHRFLDQGDTRARNVTIAVDGEPLVPWDPFLHRWGVGEMVKEATIELRNSGGEIENVRLRCFIYPHPNDVTDRTYRSEVDFSVNTQGIYVYRENRIIEGPTWLNYTREPHLNRLRVELDYTAPLDPLFQVDVKKKDLRIDQGVMDELEKILIPVRREADNRHRARGEKPPVPGKGPRPTETGIENSRGGLDLPVISKEGEKVTVAPDRGRGQPIVVIDADGHEVAGIRIDKGTDEVNVQFADSLKYAVLWEPSLGNGPGHTQVTLSTTHEWYKKAYEPNLDNKFLIQAFDYLFFALAMAELNCTRELSDYPMHQQFRLEVSQNLDRLVASFPEPPDTEG